MLRLSQDTRMKELHEELIKMGSIVEKQIYSSIEALKSQDIKLAEEIIKKDDLVDDLQKEIEDKCIKFIATQQPLATDLRLIFTTTKIVTDLERMADHAVDICKITKKLKNDKFIKELIDIPNMAKIVQSMIKRSLDAYVSGDVDESYEICKMDDEVDLYYEKIIEELIEIMSDKKDIYNQAAQLLFVCKYLERVADHTTNICEWTIYLKTGKYVDLNE